MAEVYCGSEPCPLFLNSTCVFYTGESLLYIGVQNNDTLETIIVKINQAFQNAGVGYAFTNGLIQPTPFQPVQLGGALIQNTTIGGNFTLSFTGNVQAARHITTGGSSSQFLKGDGTLDSTAYQPAANYITGLSGDATASGPGVAAMTLATVNFSSGTFGNGNTIPIVTVNAKGLVTNITPVPVTIPPLPLTFIGDVVGSGFTGTSISLLLQNVNANPYNTITPLKFSVNGKGLVTSASPITASDIVNILGYYPGTSGTSGTDGTSGTSGTAGTSGTSGTDGSGGTSGTSGTTGTSGTSATSGTSGTSGTDGTGGTSGTSGSTGTSGTSGTTGTSGSSGTTGTSGSSGTSGTTGTSGSSGTSGTTGTSGTSGISGDKYETTSTSTYTLQAAGGTGTITVATGLAYSVAQSIIIAYDANNYNEAEITSYDALTGILSFNVFRLTGSGTYSSWFVNLDGASGGDGSSGTSGTTGTSGSSGTSGTTGTSGSSGTSGTTGISGSSGTSGTSATNGTGGTSGTSGSSGVSGTGGTSGTSGSSATSGTSGTSGVNGAPGASGTSGTSGTSVAVSGTTNTMAKFTSSTTIGNSLLTDNGSVLSYSGGFFYLNNSVYLETFNTRNLIVKSTGGSDSGILGRGSSNEFAYQIYGSAPDYGFLNSAWGSWDLRKNNGGPIYLNNQSTYYYDDDVAYVYRVYGTADMRSPIYYDLDNTGYYVDPSSTTSLRTVGSWRADSAAWDGEFSGKIQYHANHWYLQAAGQWFFRNSGGANVFSVDQSGAVVASGNISGGYILGSYFNSSAGNSENPTIGQIWTQSTGDNYLRKSTPAHFRSQITDGFYVPLRIQSNWNDTTVINNVVGMLAWKNYGNSHVIFDASQSTSPSGSGVNNTNPDVAWTGTYPTLMGWNGAGTYGVRVDSARAADTVTHYASRTDGTFYNVIWGAGNPSHMYSCDAVQIQSSSGALSANLYYDNQNTAFYVDPNGSSVFNNSITTTSINGGLRVTSPGTATTQAAIAIQQVTGEADTIIFADYEPYAEYGIIARNAIDSIDFTSGTTDKSIDSYNITNRSGSTRTAYVKTRINLASGITSMGDARAPIFYDSNDTTYYADFNNQSVISRINMGYQGGQVYTTAGQGILFFNSHGESDIEGYSIGTTLENYGGNYTKLTLDWHTGIRIGAASVYGGIRFYNNSVKYYSGTQVFSVAETDNNVRVSNTLLVFGDARAPIFYDYNNTGYYLDAASTTALYDLTLVGAKHTYLYINPGNGHEAMVRYNGGSGSGWYVGKRTSAGINSTADFHFYSEAAGADVFGVTAGGIAIASGDMRAPIFYDSNNTGFYLDPATGSQLNGIVTQNYLTASNCNLAVTGLAGQITFTTNIGTFGAYWRATQHIVIENTTGGYHVYVLDSSGVGVVKYSGAQSWSAHSDARIKNVHSTLENNLSKLDGINPIYYSFNNFDDDKNRIGLIAQEVQEHFPELVNTDPKTDNLTLDYTGLIPVLIGAIKELKNKVETLETKI